jgi:hypothetical protein
LSSDQFIKVQVSVTYDFIAGMMKIYRDAKAVARLRSFRGSALAYRINDDAEMDLIDRLAKVQRLLALRRAA